MKTTWFVLLIFCLLGAESRSQTPTTAVRANALNRNLLTVRTPIHKDFPVEAQWYPTSCWAATLSMASKYLTPRSSYMNQCYFVDQLLRNLPSAGYACGCTTRINIDGVSTIGTVTLTQSDCNSFYDFSVQDNLEKRYNLALQISNKALKVTTSLNLPFLRKITSENRPIIHAYQFQVAGNDPGKHVYLISALENPNWKIAGRQFSPQLLLVKDPWPETQGSEYYITYEQFYLHSNQENIFFANAIPSPQSVETDSYIERVFEENSATSPFNTAKNFLTNLKKIRAQSARPAFYEKTGLGTNLIDLNILENGVGIIEDTEDVINNSSNYSGDTLTSYGYTEKMYFIFMNKHPKSILTVSKNFDQGVDNADPITRKWFVSRLGNAKKYRSLFNKIKLDPSGEYVIFRYKGSINKEVITKKVSINKYIKIQEISYTTDKINQLQVR